MIEDIHRAYLEAGADIIETNTFNSNARRLAEFAVGGARRRDEPQGAPGSPPAADAMDPARTPDKPRFVAGRIGPTKKQLSMGIHGR